MGEIAEMMINGILCEGCGCFVSDIEVGYPQYCSKECANDRGMKYIKPFTGFNKTKKNKKQKNVKNRNKNPRI